MKKFKAFLRPALTIMLMLSIFIPVISNVSIHVEAAEEFEAYTKSGEYPASDHIKNPIYIRPKGATEKGIVGYCFNDHKAFPESSFSPRKVYYTKEAGSGAVFEELADTERVTGEDLYNGLLRVVYDGYPNNKSGIQERYGLTDGQFRQITQFAVWYYTDSFNMPLRDTSGLAYSQNELDAFNDLINSTTAIPAGTSIDIYRSKNADYQHLLSGHIVIKWSYRRPNANANSNSYTYSYSNTNACTNSNTNACANSYTYTYSYSNTNTCTYSNTNACATSNTNPCTSTNSWHNYTKNW